ncbi:MAG: hypothetical protein WBF13_07940 [Candidatus Zixiibacteriota bacterium]
MRKSIRTCLPALLAILCLASWSAAQWEGARMERLTVNTWCSWLGKESLGIDWCDKLYLCYHESKILFTSKPKHGVWSSPEELSFGDEKSYSYAMAVNPGTGAAHVALIRYFHSTQLDLGELYCGSKDGGAWEFTRIDSSGYGGYRQRSPSMALDSLGNVHLLWMATYYDTLLNDYFSQIVYSTNASGYWLDQVVFFSGGRFGGVNPWIKVERDGVAHVMWGVGNVYHLSNDALSGTTWTADTLSQLPTTYWYFMDFKVDQSDNIHMVIEGQNYWGGPRYLYYYFRPANSSDWGNPELVSDRGCGAVIAFGPQGDVHLVWSESNGWVCGWSVCYSHRDEQGWSSYEIVGENFDYQFEIEPILSFMVDSDQNGHLAFAASEGPIIVSDSVEIFHYAPRDPYDIGHVVFLLNYLYKGGPAPRCLSDYDLDCDEELSLADVIILINYLFRGGNLPC